MVSLRCRGVSSDGNPCEVPSSLVDPRTGFCRSHAPGAREALSEQGRKGAAVTARKLRGAGLDPKDLPTLDGPQTASLWLDRVGRAVATGQMGHREATAVVRVVEAFLRAHDAGAVSDDIQRLRSALEKWTETGDHQALLEVVK